MDEEAQARVKMRRIASCDGRRCVRGSLVLHVMFLAAQCVLLAKALTIPRSRRAASRNMLLGHRYSSASCIFMASSEDKGNEDDISTYPNSNEKDKKKEDELSDPPKRQYNLGLGKNKPLVEDGSSSIVEGQTVNEAVQHWISPEPVQKPLQAHISSSSEPRDSSESKNPTNKKEGISSGSVKKRKMVARDQASQQLRSALWHEEHFGNKDQAQQPTSNTPPSAEAASATPADFTTPKLFYPDIDMSIPSDVYNETYDAVWDLLRYEAFQEAQREPLLVSFLYSTILNHHTMESSLAFLLANQLSSSMMISTQLQSFILEALNCSPDFRRAVRADMLAVRDRDPACTCLPEVFLYFKGFQALQSHRVAHWMWKNGKTVLANYLQSQGKASVIVPAA